MGVDRYGVGNKRAPRRGMRLGRSMYTISKKSQRSSKHKRWRTYLHPGVLAFKFACV